MLVIRSISKKDAEAFIELAFEAGMGLTSLPKNREVLLQRIEDSERSFLKEIRLPDDENYLFVLEDTETKKLGGVCGITSQAGQSTPLYFYHIETTYQSGPLYTTPFKIPLMRMVRYYNAPTEICSLYLSPTFRHEGLGRLLSLSRFLFIACHRERFDKIIFAEMRGYHNKSLISPFWEGIGKNFIDLEFKTLMHLRDEGSLDISQVLPTNPIYISLLPKNIQDSIGKIHPNTLPALNMLIQEGFYHTDEIDVFDGGPKIEAETDQIRTIKESILAKIKGISEVCDKGPHYIICNNCLDFRACLGFLQIDSLNEVFISSEVAQALKLQIGDLIRYAAPKGGESQ